VYIKQKQRDLQFIKLFSTTHNDIIIVHLYHTSIEHCAYLGTTFVQSYCIHTPSTM